MILMATVRLLRPSDVPAAQALMANTWSHLLKRQTGMEISYPVRPASWYLGRMVHEPGGCLCVEEGGRIVGTAFGLSCGSVGWIGPMEVSPPLQGMGLGGMLLESLEVYLSRKGCRAVGLETMRDVARNMDFYAKAGYEEEENMLYLEKPWLEGQDSGRPEKEKVDVKEIRRLGGTITKGFDPSKEFLMSEETGSGKTLYAEGAAALLLKDPISGSGKAYLRTVLSEGYHRLSEVLGLVQKAEREALWSGARTMFTILPAGSEVLPYLLRGGYQTRGVDVRLMKGSFPRKHECHIISWSG